MKRALSTLFVIIFVICCYGNTDDIVFKDGILFYDVNMRGETYEFVVKIESLEPEIVFRWVMPSKDLAARAIISKENILNAKNQKTYFSNYDYERYGKGTTAVWLSKMNYLALKLMKFTKITFDSGSAEKLKLTGSKTVPVTVNGEPVDIGLITAKSESGKYLEVLDDIEHPVIMNMELDWGTVKINRIFHKTALIEHIGSLYDSGDPGSIKSAIYFTAYFDLPEFADKVIAAIDKEDTRVDAMWACGRLKLKQALPKVLPYMDSNDYNTYYYAVFATRMIKDPSSIPQLLKVLKKEKDLTSSKAETIIYALGDFKDPRPVKDICAILDKETSRLSALKPEEEDKNVNFRWTCLDSLLQLASPASVKTLKALQLVEKDKTNLSLIISALDKIEFSNIKTPAVKKEKKAKPGQEAPKPGKSVWFYAKVKDFYEDNKIVVLGRGSNDMVREDSGEVYFYHNAISGTSSNINWSFVIAKGRIIKVTPDDTVIHITDMYDKIASGDIAEFTLVMPVEKVDNPLLLLALYDITFKSPSDDRPYNSVDAVKNISDASYNELLKMIEKELKDYINTEDIKSYTSSLTVDEGKFKGMNWYDAGMAVTTEDIREFFLYVKYYPSRYLTNEYNFAETLYTWIINGAEDTLNEQRADQAKPVYNDALDLLSEGKIDESAERLRKVLEIKPDHEDAKNKLTLIEDIAYLREVTSRDPDDLNSLYDLAYKYWRAGLYEISNEKYTICVEKKFKEGASRFNIGRNYFDMGDTKKAFEIYSSLGGTYEKETEEKWIKYTSSLLKLSTEKNDPQAFINIADVFYHDEVYADAKDYYQKALSADPDNKYAKEMIGKIKIHNDVDQYLLWAADYWDEFKFEDAKTYWIEALSAAMELNDKELMLTIYNKIAKSYENAEMYDEAIEIYGRIIEFDNTNFDGYFGIAYAYQGLLEYGKAMEWTEKALQKFPDDVSFLNSIGFDLMKLGRFDEAVPYLERAKKDDPQYLNPRKNLAVCLFEKDLDASVQILKDALSEVDNNDYETRKKLGELVLLKDLKDKKSTSPDEKIILAKIYYDFMRYDAGLSVLAAVPQNFERYRDVLYEMGRIYYQKNDYGKALEYFEKQKKIYPNPNADNFISYCKGYMEKDREKRAMHFGRGEMAISSYYSALLNFARIETKIPGLDKLIETAKIGYKAAKDMDWAYEWTQKYNYGEAVKYLKEAEKLAFSINDMYMLVDICYKTANGYLDLGQYDLAWEYYNAAVKYRKAVNADDKDTVLDQCFKYYYTSIGDFNKALEYAEKNLKRVQRDFLYNDLGITHADLADCYTNMGDYENALEHYNAALEVYKNNLNSLSEVYQRKNIIYIYLYQQEFDKALEDIPALEKAFIKIEKNAVTAQDIYNILGQTYQYIGVADKAIVYFDKGYATASRLGNNYGRGAFLNNSSEVFLYITGDLDKAAERLLKAQVIFENMNVPSGLAPVYSNLADLYFKKKEYDKAIEYAEKAKTIAIDYNYGYEYNAALHLEASVEFEKGNTDKAFEYCAELLDRVEGRKRGAFLWKGRYLMGRILYGQNKKEEAVQKLESAVEALRKTTQSMKSEEGQRSFLKAENKFEVYEKLISILMELKRYDESIKYLEEIKSRIIMDTFENYNKELQQLKEKKSSIEEELQKELEKPKEMQSKDRIKYLSENLAKNESEFNRLVTSIEDNYDDFAKLRVDPDLLADMKDNIPKDSVILFYFFADEKLFIMTVGNNYFNAQSVAIKAEELEEKVLKLRAFITMPGEEKNTNETLAELYDILIRPIEPTTDKYETLIILPYNVLFYVPFAALVSENTPGAVKYLIDDKNVTTLCNATLNDLFNTPKKSSEYSFVGFGNPDGSLAYSEKELEDIRNTVFTDGKIFLKDDATKENFFEEAKNYSILHISTHGKLKPVASDSYLLLAGTEEESKLTLEEITGYTDLKGKAVLAVLSACETALEKNKSIGKDFLSLSKAFARAGVPAIIASLWKVSDESTELIFTEFYKNLKTKNMNKAEALRAAQKSIKSMKEFSSPFFWAPYILNGDYR